MLPEHVTMLRQLKERTNDKQKPILDEQLLQELNQTICNAIKAKTALEITYYEEHNFQTVTGVVKYYDNTLQHIRIANNENSYLKLAVENVIDIKIAD